jgi:hypothetical protein
MSEKGGGKACETAFGRPQGAEISKCEKKIGQITTRGNKGPLTT